MTPAPPGAGPTEKNKPWLARVPPMLLDTARRTLRRLAGRTRTSLPARPTNVSHASPRAHYPGDATGPVDIQYEPIDDDRPDPGEVVWTWVPYEENHSHGKDRPVLVIGREGPLLLAVPLTSKDHDRDAAQEAAAGRHWVDVGAGPWDTRGRPSEARVDRILRLDPATIRRAGATLDRTVFEHVAREISSHR